LLEDEPQIITCKYKTGNEWDELNRLHPLVIPEVYLQRANIILDGLKDLKQLLDHPNAIKEQEFYAEEGGIAIKAKPDCILDGTLYDIKFTEKAIFTKYEVERFVVQGMYYMQLAHYRDILDKNSIVVDKCVLIAVNHNSVNINRKHNGVAITYAQVDEDYLKYGLYQRDLALSLYKTYNGNFSDFLRQEKIINKPAYFRLPDDNEYTEQPCTL
jgi:hypothetical protein